MSGLCEICGESVDPEEGHALCVIMIAKERDRLRTALKEYGGHHELCGIWRDDDDQRARCTCGLAEALGESAERSGRSLLVREQLDFWTPIALGSEEIQRHESVEREERR